MFVAGFLRKLRKQSEICIHGLKMIGTRLAHVAKQGPQHRDVRRNRGLFSREQARQVDAREEAGPQRFGVALDAHHLAREEQP